MKKKFIVLLSVLMLMLCGCGENDLPVSNEPVANDFLDITDATDDLSKSEIGTEEKLSDEQVLSAIQNYCYISNPDLESIVNAEEYPVYWEIASSDEHEIVVLYRSYTGSQNRYYINRTTGDTYVTEYVPGITTQEQRTDEKFNVKDFY